MKKVYVVYGLHQKKRERNIFQIIGVPEGKVREKEAESLFEEIMSENYNNLLTNTQNKKT